MPSSLMWLFPLVCLMPPGRAEPEAEAEALTYLLAPISPNFYPRVYFSPSYRPAPFTYPSQTAGHQFLGGTNFANFPTIDELNGINPQNTLLVRPSLVLETPSENYNEGAVMVQKGLAQASGNPPSNVGPVFMTTSNDPPLSSLFSPLPVTDTGVDNNLNNMNKNTNNRGINTNRKDQRHNGNHRHNSNDRFNSNGVRDYHSNKVSNNIRDNNRPRRYNCSSDGIFPDQNSDCQRYYICQRNQVMSYRQQKQRQNCKIISKVWEFDCGLGQLYDASQAACAPAYTVDNWCNVPNTVNYGPGTSSYIPGSKIVVDMSGILC